ncbi:uncharacterized protein [Syngnathus scovelli]|nr:uncharacterized protein LOC125981251 isoform X2 [Syngnathus scovelli]XP_049597163.1 uncharacterized protein LOC125981251 isoform X2 [Syngnathus scovelli]
MDANSGNKGKARGARGRGRPRIEISDEVRAALVDHVVNRGLTMTEAGKKVQPNMSRYTVASIIRAFQNDNRTERLATRGGRERLLSPEQETAIRNMVLENNAITLQQMQRRVVENNDIFQNIHRVSFSTLDRALRRNNLWKKQVYRVPFQHNSARVKELRYNYVHQVLELQVADVEHRFVFIDEVGFNLTKRGRGRGSGWHKEPGRHRWNITMCAAITHHGVIHRHAAFGPYNTAHLITFLDDLHEKLIPPNGVDGPEQLRYVVIWDNVSFHRAAAVRKWFSAHARFVVVNLPPYSPFLNPVDEFFLAWRWKVYERNPQARSTLLQAMEEACGDIGAEAFVDWICHARRYFPHCMARENIDCDVDEVLWSDRNRRADAA